MYNFFIKKFKTKPAIKSKYLISRKHEKQTELAEYVIVYIYSFLILA